jgi:hypothetical protein
VRSGRLPWPCCGEHMTKKTSRARKRPSKAKPSEADARSVEQIVAELIADPAVQAAYNAAYPSPPRAFAVSPVRRDLESGKTVLVSTQRMPTSNYWFNGSTLAISVFIAFAAALSTVGFAWYRAAVSEQKMGG